MGYVPTSVHKRVLIGSHDIDRTTKLHLDMNLASKSIGLTFGNAESIGLTYGNDKKIRLAIGKTLESFYRLLR